MRSSDAILICLKLETRSKYFKLSRDNDAPERKRVREDVLASYIIHC